MADNSGRPMRWQTGDRAGCRFGIYRSTGQLQMFMNGNWKTIGYRSTTQALLDTLVSVGKDHGMAVEGDMLEQALKSLSG